jgi:hypothetical protein
MYHTNLDCIDLFEGSHVFSLLNLELVLRVEIYQVSFTRVTFYQVY